MTLDTAASRPRLDTGLTVLSVPGARTTAPHRLALAEVRARDGPTYWVDARNAASTYVLYDLARPSDLDALAIARAFTAYQHHTLVRSLIDTAGDAAFVVVPNVASLYSDDDLAEREGADLLGDVLAELAALATDREIPVLVTDDGRDPALTDVVRAAGDAHVACHRTREGFRFDGDGFETTVYWHDRYWQTTIPYWVELFGAVTDPDPYVAADIAGVA